MNIYFKGGTLDGRAKFNIDKRIKTFKNPLPNGEVEWYERRGKRIILKHNKQNVEARVFKFRNKTKQIMEKKKPIEFGII